MGLIDRLSPGRFRFAARRRRDAYVNVFTSPDGEIVLADLLKECGWDKDLFHDAPTVTANLLGRRWVILHIKSIMRQTNQQLEDMLAHERRQQENFPDA